jgi:hypothetical protein
MCPDIRRLVACALLMLLPIQAMASVAARSCTGAMANCHEMAAANMDCCADGTPTDPAQSSVTHHGGPGQYPDSCSMGAGCAAMCQLFALPASQPVALRVGLAILATDYSSHFLSFIPEGLQRPPSILA